MRRSVCAKKFRKEGRLTHYIAGDDDLAGRVWDSCHAGTLDIWTDDKHGFDALGNALTTPFCKGGRGGGGEGWEDGVGKGMGVEE